MKNKVYLKKHLYGICLVVTIFLVIFLILNNYSYHKYTESFNNKFNSMISLLKKEGLSDEEIIQELNKKVDKDYLINYGILSKTDNVILENNTYFVIFTVINVILITGVISLIIWLFMHYNKKKDQELLEITKCIERINKEDYKLDLDTYEEGELAILKGEIRKTTTMLKSIASNNLQAKINLKNSLEDISHQLKTPLTSILINLDNLIDNPDISKDMQDKFLREIKRSVNHLEFLVTTILNLSKFDASTIKFNKTKNDVTDIINKVKQNTEALCDLKNITLNIKGDKCFINCDIKWQVEALTNILKNCIEYSHNDSMIDIIYEQNKVYTMIVIKDYGDGISKKDLPHIFERFYKGEHASSDSVGIGLALAKEIIKHDNGNIDVVSNDNGTKFIIKYFNI